MCHAKNVPLTEISTFKMINGGFGDVSKTYKSQDALFAKYGQGLSKRTREHETRSYISIIRYVSGRRAKKCMQTAMVL